VRRRLYAADKKRLRDAAVFDGSSQVGGEEVMSVVLGLTSDVKPEASDPAKEEVVPPAGPRALRGNQPASDIQRFWRQTSDPALPRQSAMTLFYQRRNVIIFPRTHAR
jgi:hypothetical protein